MVAFELRRFQNSDRSETAGTCSAHPSRGSRMTNNFYGQTILEENTMLVGVVGSGMRPALHVPVLILLVVLSGCSGFFALGEQYPPGVTERGVSNATALADAHADTLRPGYRVERVSTFRAPNGSVVQEIHSTTWWSATERRLVTSFERPHVILGVHAELYSNESGTWIQIRRASGATNILTGPLASWRSLIAGPTGAWSTIYTMATARSTTITMVANGTTRIQFAGANYDQGNASGSMYLTERGFVTRYEMTSDGMWRNQPARVHTTRNYSSLGNTDITPPVWLSNTTNA